MARLPGASPTHSACFEMQLQFVGVLRDGQPREGMSLESGDADTKPDLIGFGLLPSLHFFICEM